MRYIGGLPNVCLDDGPAFMDRLGSIAFGPFLEHAVIGVPATHLVLLVFNLPRRASVNGRGRSDGRCTDGMAEYMSLLVGIIRYF